MDNRESDSQEVLMLRFQTFIPKNEYHIEEGYYLGNANVKPVGGYKDCPEIIDFMQICWMNKKALVLPVPFYLGFINKINSLESCLASLPVLFPPSVLNLPLIVE